MTPISEKCLSLTQGAIQSPEHGINGPVHSYEVRGQDIKQDGTPSPSATRSIHWGSPNAAAPVAKAARCVPPRTPMAAGICRSPFPQRHPKAQSEG